VLITNVFADEEAWATKCYILAPRGGTECVIVDVGFGVAGRLDDALRSRALRPVAVLLTHGHLDHTHAVTDVCAAYRIPAYIHPADNEMLTDPFSGIGEDFVAQFEKLVGPNWKWKEPADVRPLAGGTVLELAGLELRVDHTPGHTPGSTMFSLSPREQDQSFCLVGDVLYAGTIGRTDLPGGNRGQTLTALKGLLAMPDETVLLTAHEGNTTVGTERAANPFMRQAAAWDPEAPA
jgi:glyoxylase-like metal-dependent hydrolase (beta-lactamase superfamily II)